MRNLRIRRSHAGAFILLTTLLAAQANDLNSGSQDGTVSSEAAPSDGQDGPGVNAFAPQGGGSGSRSGSMHRIGIGVNVSILLGIGIQGAVRVTPKSNVRGGFNFFNYSTTVTQSGFSIDGQLHLRSAEALYDWFPFGGGFHLSPGAMIYNGNKVIANLTTNAGTTFTLNGTTYTSSATNPVSGVATVQLYNYKVAPMFLLGWGHLIPRGGRHFGATFDIGAAVTGSPTLAMNLAGTACSPSGGCVNAATDPGVQSNLQTTEHKANNSLNVLKAFPVIAVGFGYSF
jgi:hypothetical protein